MSGADLLSRLRDRGLTAWQAGFVQSFVDEAHHPSSFFWLRQEPASPMLGSLSRLNW